MTFDFPQFRPTLNLVERIYAHIAQAAFRWVPTSTQLQGRRLKAMDGTSARLADTPGNQQAFPQPTSQNPGAGFPVMKIVASFCVATGAILAQATGNLCRSEISYGTSSGSSSDQNRAD
jgi:hypothetical protein